SSAARTRARSPSTTVTVSFSDTPPSSRMTAPKACASEAAYRRRGRPGPPSFTPASSATRCAGPAAPAANDPPSNSASILTARPKAVHSTDVGTRSLHIAHRPLPDELADAEEGLQGEG